VEQPVVAGVKITSPAAAMVLKPTSRPSTISGSSGDISEGDTINVRARVTGNGVITVVYTINGKDQAPVSSPPYSMQYFVPYTLEEIPPPLKIKATATDGTGDTADDSVTVKVVRNITTESVRILEPAADAKATAGDTIVIRAKTDYDSKVAFVTFTVDGDETVMTAPPFTRTHVLPRRATSIAAVSTIPPNVFVGKATLDGAPAPDGTVVTAWIAGSDATSLVIKVTATADSGETDVTSLSLPVSGSINAGEGVVKGGRYAINVAQPLGQVFGGKPVTFTIDAKDAHQTGTWQ